MRNFLNADVPVARITRVFIQLILLMFFVLSVGKEWHSKLKTVPYEVLKAAGYFLVFTQVVLMFIGIMCDQGCATGFAYVIVCTAGFCLMVSIAGAMSDDFDQDVMTKQLGYIGGAFGTSCLTLMGVAHAMI